jgi:hypothetical protein
MLLTYKSTSTGHPLIKNANGSLRLGRWWYVIPTGQHFTSMGHASASYFAQAMLSSAHSAAKGASSWVTQPYTGNFQSAFLATAFSEGYNANPEEEWYEPFADVYSTVCLYSFTMPTALQSRTIRKVMILAYKGGATLQEYSGDYVPLFPNPWYYNGILGWKFFTSKPSSPYAMGSTAHTTLSVDVLTQAGYGSSIVYDSGGLWTQFSGGEVNISTPASVNSICQGATTVWLGVWFNTVTNFTIPSNYSRAYHLQNVRAGVPSLWLYA